MSEPQASGHNSKEQLKSIVNRVETLNEQIKELGSDRSDIFKEAGGQGFDVKALRRVVAIRKMDAGKHEEFENVVETYLHAIGEGQA